MNTWILLRGLTRESRHWGGFPQLLRAALPGDLVLTLDLPGNGDSHALASPTRIEGMAAFCREDLRQRGVQPPFHLMAESLGAMVAAAWAQEHPEDIACCVLINTSFGSLSPLHQRLRLRAWPAFLRIFLDPTPEGRERRILALTSARPEDHPEAVQAWAAISRDRPVRLGNVLRQILAAARYRAPLRAPVPALVLSGARDRLVDPRCSQAIVRQWRCAQAIHPEAGHDLPLDDGAWIARELQVWLQGLSAG